MDGCRVRGPLRRSERTLTENRLPITHAVVMLWPTDFGLSPAITCSCAPIIQLATHFPSRRGDAGGYVVFSHESAVSRVLDRGVSDVEDAYRAPKKQEKKKKKHHAIASYFQSIHTLPTYLLSNNSFTHVQKARARSIQVESDLRPSYPACATDASTPDSPGAQPIADTESESDS